MDEEREFYGRLAEKGISRRDFMKFCGVLTATMGLSSSFIPKVAEVFAAPKQRPPVVWLHFAECTGCSEAALRTMYPWIDELVLEILSLEYHETIMAAAGQQAEDILHAAVKKYNGKFICVVEGAIATKYNLPIVLLQDIAKDEVEAKGYPDIRNVFNDICILYSEYINGELIKLSFNPKDVWPKVKQLIRDGTAKPRAPTMAISSSPRLMAGSSGSARLISPRTATFLPAPSTWLETSPRRPKPKG